MKLKDLLLAIGLCLSPLLTSQNVYTQNVAKAGKPLENIIETEIIKPSLEEIAELMSKFPQEVLKPTIDKGYIKKFEYTRQTTSKDFYKFLTSFNNERLFGFICIDESSVNKNKDVWVRDRGTSNLKTGSNSAMVFIYLNRNLKDKADIGFFYFELKDFYGVENWKGLYKTFDIKSLSIPCIVKLAVGKIYTKL